MSKEFNEWVDVNGGKGDEEDVEEEDVEEKNVKDCNVVSSTLFLIKNVGCSIVWLFSNCFCLFSFVFIKNTILTKASAQLFNNCCWFFWICECKQANTLNSFWN